MQGAKDAGLSLDQTSKSTTQLSQAFRLIKPLAQAFGIELGNVGASAKIASAALRGFGPAGIVAGITAIVVGFAKLEESLARTKGQLDDAFKGRGEEAFAALTQQAQTFGTTVGGLQPGLVALQTALSNVDRAAQGFVALRAEDLPSALAAPSVKAVTAAYENFIKILRAGRLTQDEAEKSAATFFKTMEDGGKVTSAALKALPVGTIDLLKQALGAAGLTNKQFFDAIDAGVFSVDKLQKALAGFGPQAQRAFDSRAIKTMGDEIDKIITTLSAGFEQISGKTFSTFVINQLEAIRKGLEATRKEIDLTISALRRFDEATEVPGLGPLVQKLRNVTGIGADVVPLPRPRPPEADTQAETQRISSQTTALNQNITAKKENAAATAQLAANTRETIGLFSDDVEAIIKQTNALHDALIEQRRGIAPAEGKTFAAPGEQAEQAGKNAAAAFKRGWISAPAEKVKTEDAVEIKPEAATAAGNAAVAAFGEAFKQGTEPIAQQTVSTFQQKFTDATLTVPPFQVEDAFASMQQLFDRIVNLFATPIKVALQGEFTGPLGTFTGGGGGEFLAGGGRVRGPGSWTSDSVLAHLSRDEFVQPARRVAQYGMDFMEAIRRGLLSQDAVRALMGDFRGLRFGGSAFPRFAEGGVVTSGGSRTLNLILGGQTFPVSGSAKVIDSLEREAALRSIASTGIAQSFVGRR